MRRGYGERGRGREWLGGEISEESRGGCGERQRKDRGDIEKQGEEGIVRERDGRRRGREGIRRKIRIK